MNPNKFQITLLTENRLVNHFIKEAIDPDYAILEEITTGKQNWLEDLSNNPPDLLIIRRTLIHEDGMEVAKRISRNPTFSSTKILLLAMDKKVGEDAIANGAKGFLTIPFSRQNLLHCLNNLLTREIRILFVDDSRSIQAMVSASLRDAGFVVEQALNGQQALEKLETSNPFNLIVSDVEMPEMDGFTLCQTVKESEKFATIPFILSTSLENEESIQKGFEAGAVDYLTKPIVMPELISRAQQHVVDGEASREETILIAEKSSKTQNLITHALLTHGFASKNTEKGDQILKILKNEGHNLLIIDSAFHEIEVASVIRDIREDQLLIDLPVIALADAESRAEIVRIRSAGVQGVINKPFKAEQLLAEVERILAQDRLERHKKALKPYVSSEALEAIEKRSKSKDDLQARAVDQHRSIFFCDLAGFTRMTENLGARETVDMLNKYFDCMVSILVKHNATIDKFVGDCIMAVFAERERGAKDAVLGGLAMLKALPRLRSETGVDFHIRIGVNSGHVMMGDLGSKLHRRDFTVIGDTVNVAARLESIAETDHLFMSEATYDLVRDHIDVEEKGEIQVKGRNKAVRVFKALN